MTTSNLWTVWGSEFAGSEHIIARCTSHNAADAVAKFYSRGMNLTTSVSAPYHTF